MQKPYTTASTAATDTPRSRSYNTRSNPNYNQKSTVDLGLPKNTRLYNLQNTASVPHTESFTLNSYQIYQHVLNTINNTQKEILNTRNT